MSKYVIIKKYRLPIYLQLGVDTISGKLIVIDGLDGSGKSTQSQRVYHALKSQYSNISLLSYPDYTQPSSTLVKMYLDGMFSDNPNDVNAYAASTFYAADRYASYMQFWKEQYQKGGLFLATRYVSSNAIHQMVKLPKSQWDSFLNWLEDYEYDKLKLPRPDKVIFLKMSRHVANELISGRYHGDESKKDIHEKNMSYLQACMESAEYAAKRQNWSVISCCDGIKPYSIEKITCDILTQIQQIL